MVIWRNTIKYEYDCWKHFYKISDEDGDMITFSSQEELNEAINGELEKFDIYIQGTQFT